MTHGAATVKSRMRSLLIVEVEPVPERLASLAAGFELPEVGTLPFHRAPQPLDKDVIHPPAFAIHGDGDTGILERLREVLASELRSLVRVKDFRHPITIHVSTGISIDRINLLLDKKSDPTGDEILILADYFKCDFKFFISNEQLAPFEQTELLFRKNGSHLTKNDRRVIQDMMFLCENEEFLMSELSYPKKRFVFDSQDSYFKRKGKNAALRLRKFLGYDINEIASDVYRDCRLLGMHVFRKHLENSSISGICLKHPVAGPCILINYSEDIYRQRFSIAHELAHAILDTDEEVSITFEKKSHELKEVRANYFASNYLMPPELLGTIPKNVEFAPDFIISLSSRLMVNIEPLLYALQDNKLITKTQVDYLKSLSLKHISKDDPELSITLSKNNRERKKNFLKKGLSSFYVELCLEAFEKGVISQQRMAEMLLIHPLELHQFYSLYGKEVIYND